MTTRKRKPRSTAPKPQVAPSVTIQRRDLSELSLFELGLLPFLYLEAGVKAGLEFINKRYPL